MAREYTEGLHYRIVITYKIGTIKNPSARAGQQDEAYGLERTEIFGPYKSPGTAKTAAANALRSTFYSYWYNLDDLKTEVQMGITTWVPVE